MGILLLRWEILKINGEILLFLNVDIRLRLHKFLFDVGGKHTCLSRRILGLESRYGNYIALFSLNAFS